MGSSKTAALKISNYLAAYFEQPQQKIQFNYSSKFPLKKKKKKNKKNKKKKKKLSK